MNFERHIKYPSQEETGKVLDLISVFGLKSFGQTATRFIKLPNFEKNPHFSGKKAVSDLV